MRMNVVFVLFLFLYALVVDKDILKLFNNTHVFDLNFYGVLTFHFLGSRDHVEQRSRLGKPRVHKNMQKLIQTMRMNVFVFVVVVVVVFSLCLVFFFIYIYALVVDKDMLKLFNDTHVFDPNISEKPISVLSGW